VYRGLPLDCAVLKVAHHGSSTSTCAEFLAAASPQLAVISVGADNEYGHPHASVMERLSARGIPVLSTADHGTIECITDGATLWLGTGRS
jgi:competence protein ComEC